MSSTPVHVCISIGLNVGNSEPKDQLKRTIKAILSLGNQLEDLRTLADGDYDGIKERRVWAELSISQWAANSGALHGAMEQLANDLQQDTIAYYVHGDEGYGRLAGRNINGYAFCAAYFWPKND